MKKNRVKKLVLSRETMCELSNKEMRHIVGGVADSQATDSCGEPCIRISKPTG